MESLGKLLFIPHDRTFLRGRSNHVLELGGAGMDRAEPLTIPGPTKSMMDPLRRSARRAQLTRFIYGLGAQI
jgi:hypothetical protein